MHSPDVDHSRNDMGNLLTISVKGEDTRCQLDATSPGPSASVTAHATADPGRAMNVAATNGTGTLPGEEVARVLLRTPDYLQRRFLRGVRSR